MVCKVSGFVLILVSLTAVAPIFVLPANAQPTQTIIINGNGEVTPSATTIQREGSIYTLTADIDGSIVVLANNIIINGANHTLQGPEVNENSLALDSSSVAVNLTAANVTVENMQITNWHAGILGAWNNNTITNCELTNDFYGMPIYGDDYVVSQNNISNCTVGLLIDGGGFRAQGDNNLITRNLITGSSQEAVDILNSNGTTITENNIAKNNIILTLATSTQNTILYYNNFINNKNVLTVPFPEITGNYSVPFSPAGQWDNGGVGNYWSDYLTKYPNAKETDYTGTGDTPYIINATTTYSTTYANGTEVTGVTVLGTATDNHPLITPFSTITSTPTPPPSPQPRPSSNITIAAISSTAVVVAGAILLVYRKKRALIKKEK